MSLSLSCDDNKQIGQPCDEVMTLAAGRMHNQYTQKLKIAQVKQTVRYDFWQAISRLNGKEALRTPFGTVDILGTY